MLCLCRAMEHADKKKVDETECLCAIEHELFGDSSRRKRQQKKNVPDTDSKRAVAMP